MKAYRRDARKRAVNLTLSEDLVQEAKVMTERLAKAKALEATILMWNEFNANSGSIADEYSSL
jgi:hypothetical protein